MYLRQKGHTLLHHAVKNNHLEAVKLLLQNENFSAVNYQIPDVRIYVPLSFYLDDPVEFQHYLQQKNATALHLAVLGKGKSEIVKFLLNHKKIDLKIQDQVNCKNLIGFNQNLILFSIEKNETTPLMFASIKRVENNVRLILEKIIGDRIIVA